MPTAVAVLVNGNVVASVTGNNSGSLDWQAMDLSAYQGQQAQLQVIDQSDGSNGWGHLIVDNPVLSDTRAVGWANQTGANLIVNGQVVRSATGNNSPGLDWASWNVSDLQGQQAQVQIVDQNSGSDWGHTIADNFEQADAPPPDAAQRANWIDWGNDFYAAVTYNDAPHGQRLMVGWMSNWDYAQSTPTGAWRGEQSVTRQAHPPERQRSAPADPDAGVAGETGHQDDQRQTGAGLRHPGRGGHGHRAADRRDAAARQRRTTSASTCASAPASTPESATTPPRKSCTSIAPPQGTPASAPRSPAYNGSASTWPGKPLTLKILVDSSSVEVFANGRPRSPSPT